MDTILRYLEMLRFIPKEPDTISTPDLLLKLQDLGYEVDIRTVQRDLNKLSASGLFPFTSSEDTKPIYWFWPKQAQRQQFPLMTTEEALTFKLVEQFLIPLLPLSVKDQLADYFALADGTLKISPLANWVDKVRIIPNNQSLLPAQINSEVLSVVYEALLKNRRFTAVYRRRGKPTDELKPYEVNPLGLMFKGSAVYLLATLWDYQDIKQLAMHRFQEAALSDKPALTPKGFKLDDYIAEGGFDYPTEPERNIKLVLKIQPWLNKQLTETPLSQNQLITPIDESTFQLKATVKDTRQLRWWLKSLGNDIEVIEPKSLREEFAENAKALGRMYQ
jgi:predicted DNA-binding transcriptional regulator YafY